MGSSAFDHSPKLRPVLIPDRSQQFRTVPEPSQIFYSSILSDYSGYNISCNGESDGEINTTATAGSGGFSYSIDRIR